MKKSLIILIGIFLYNYSAFANELEILEDVPGVGIEIKKHYKISVNYRGFLENGIEFDSSFKRKEPFNFQIGLRQVIEGWDKGLIGMKVGGERTLKIPPNLAYGSQGAGDLIPPNSTLIFEVTILNAHPPDYETLLASQIALKQKEGFILIDIRTLKERKLTGTIRGSLNIAAFDALGNFDPNFIKKYQAIADKDDHVVFISNNGEMSALLANGFSEKLGSLYMYSLAGGIKNWTDESRELVN